METLTSKRSGLLEVNGALLKVCGETRLHKIQDNRVRDSYYELPGLNLTLRKDNILFINYRWSPAHLEFIILSAMKMKDVNSVYLEQEFYNDIAYVLHRMSESLVIK